MGVTILAKVGDFSRFSSPDKLLAYAGLSPSTCPDSSGTAMLIWKSAAPYISNLLFSTPPGTFFIGIPFLPLISPKSGRKAS
ncbi:transposase, partial [Muricomes intestini]|uniref:transposase n=1 Tax=Muricomes intestini TaxID=1796634 RepID=UPI002FE0B07D